LSVVPLGLLTKATGRHFLAQNVAESCRLS
jgi:hypothetical protein